MHINNCLKFKVLERTSKEAFQALWIEIESPKSKNIVCGVIYRQHNDPEQFLNPAEVANIINHYFASIGPRLARNISSPRKNFQDYLAGTNHYKSFFFDPVSSSEVDMEILATPSNKVYGLHSCPVHLLKSVRHSLSPLLAALMNKSISTGIYSHLLKHAKVIPVYKTGDETDLE